MTIGVTLRATPADEQVDAALAQFDEGTVASGVETDEDDIDDVLYG